MYSYLCACRRRSCHTRITKEIKLRQWLAVDDSQGDILGDRKPPILKCKPHRALSSTGQRSRSGTFTNCTDRGWRGGAGYGRISDGGGTGELTFSVWWSSVWVEQFRGSRGLPGSRWILWAVGEAAGSMCLWDCHSALSSLSLNLSLRA